MSNSNSKTQGLLKQYFWLADLIDSSDGITLKDISDKWESSSYNSTGKPYARRTFVAHLEAIQELFDMIIYCDRSDGFKYKVDPESSDEAKKMRQLLLSTMSLSYDTKGLEGRVLVEDIPSGRKSLSGVMDAMRENRVISFYHVGFHHGGEGYQVELEPWAVKMANRRWYVLGRDTIKNEVRVYALDRFTNFEVLDRKFKVPNGFDAEGYFSEYQGVYITDVPLETIRVRVNAKQASYMRSLPWHHSQKELERNGDYSVFELRLRPTPDFIKDMAREAPDYTVLSPKSVVGAVDNEILKFKPSYEKKF
jgi:predicted DNA-binding transcriptional regulator YafY